MTPGPRTHKQAAVDIVDSETLPPHLRARVREVHNLRSLEPGNGHATALMHQVCAEADRERMTLMLMVSQPDDAAMDNSVMCAWYGRFGFKPTKEGYDAPVVMIRPAAVPAIVRGNLTAALAARA